MASRLNFSAGDFICRGVRLTDADVAFDESISTADIEDLVIAIFTNGAWTGTAQVDGYMGDNMVAIGFIANAAGLNVWRHFATDDAVAPGVRHTVRNLRHVNMYLTVPSGAGGICEITWSGRRRK